LQANSGAAIVGAVQPWPAAIICDFDGVLVDSEPLHMRAFQEALADDGIALSEKEYYAELIGFDDRGAIRHVLNKHHRNADAAAFSRLLAGKSDRMRQMIRDGLVPALPGAKELVVALRDYPMAICSGALRVEIEMMLDSIGLRRHFPVIVAAEDVAVGKPDPSGYFLALKLLADRAGASIAPGDALVIEDAPVVIRAVRSAGFAVLGVATTCPPQALAQAHYVVNSLQPEQVLEKIPELQLRLEIKEDRQ